MIHIQKDFDPPPEKLRSPGCKNLIERTLFSRKKQNASYNFYRNKNVVKRLKKIFHYKCAYCEVLTNGGFHVDHYRPISSVKNLSKEHHKGYYWLSCEWSNLIFSCNACNQYKSNQFPVENEFFRVIEPGDQKEWRADSITFTREKALLIHPQIDKPEKHFVFLPDGNIKAITEKGEQTNIICQLFREDLIFRRHKAIQEIIDRINEEISLFITKEHNEMELHAGLRSVFSSLFSKIDNFDSITY